MITVPLLVTNTLRDEKCHNNPWEPGTLLIRVE